MVLGIYGAGGLGREVLDLARVIHAKTGSFEEIVFINDNKRECCINGASVFTFDAFKTAIPAAQAKIVIAVGEPMVRQVLREKITADGYRLGSLVHPLAFVGTETQLDDGVIVQFGSFVSCNVKLETNVLIQPNAVVGHDSVIGSDTVISSYVAISGSCTVGARTYIGLSVPVRENTVVGADTIVGMGSVVLREIPESVIALGNPARVMKHNESGRVFKTTGQS